MDTMCGLMRSNCYPKLGENASKCLPLQCPAECHHRDHAQGSRVCRASISFSSPVCVSGAI